MGGERRHWNAAPGREDLAASLARAHQVELERAREVLRRAERAAAEDPQARSVRQWFAYLVEADARVPEVGKHTQLTRPDDHAHAAQGRAGRAGGVPVPGRRTLVMQEALDEEPGPDVAPPRREPTRLGVLQQWRMSQAFGFDFNGVSIRRASPLATGATRALVQDGEVHFRAGAYQPGTREGDWLLAHELAHVVQQQGGRGERVGSRRELEREADRAATLAVQGRAAPIALRAQPGVAYAFSDGEEHEVAEIAAPGESGAEATADAGGDGAAESIEESTPAEPGAPTAGDAEVAAANAAPAGQREHADDDGEAARVAPPTAGEWAVPEAAAPEVHEGDARHAHAEGVSADAIEEAAIDAAAAAAHEALASAHDPVAPEVAVSGSALEGGGAAVSAEGAAGDAGAGAEAAATEGAAVVASAEEGSYDPRAELAMAPVPGEGGGEGAGAPGDGKGAPPKPQKAAPNVAGAPPEAGFPQLQGVRPDKLVLALGSLHGAATADVGKQRAEAKANPPKQMSNGDGAAAKAAPGALHPKSAIAGAPGAGGKQAAPGAAAKADQPIKGEVPGGQAAKQAQQGQAKQEQQNAGAPIAAAAQQHVWWLQAFSGRPAGGASAANAKAGGNAEPAMSDAEKQRMSSSLASLPTKADSVSTDPGPAPELAMQGAAKSTSDRDRAQLEAKTAQLASQGRADSRVPLGEDHIETSVPTEELTARSVPGGAVPEVALPTLAGAAPSEEVAIVAQEQSGAQIDAALAKASTDVATERAKHAQEEQQARAAADQQLRELKTKADADQAAARAAAKAESEQARGAWQAEIDKQGADARKQADKKVTEGMAQVAAEEAKANAEAQKHIEEGQQQADQEKQKGEEEAARAKEQGQKKSSGFLGWLSSKAKAFFDGIKKAISAAIDAARKAVQAVLAAAKKLAMAAIELARQAITAAIKAIGDALLAITDVLLAAFPALKAKFQAAIRAAVTKAIATVNKLAEGLKKAVQAALDRLGTALDAALSLLEKGLHALVDLVGDVVQGAIDAAKAIVDALGAWAKIIKDVATGPGAWLGKLGAAVVDGIKNHLWSAFKTAVAEWFQSKVIEVLGVAGVILQVLLEGGITMDDIVKMALDALMVALPMALVAILIEKLVAMLVPAAGALMAIIEGLQAAWGTVSRIIAAFSAFMAFLSAVQGGGAGPLFATALASAAVVVLDFVANWLLQKLRGPAAKVGKKLEGIAEKLKLKRKGKGAAKGQGAPGSKPKQQAADGPDGPSAPGGTKAKPKQHDADGPDGPSGTGGKPKRMPDDADGPSAPGGKPKRKPDPDKDKKQPDRDKDKKQEQDRKDKALVERAARQAASAGWRHAKAESGSRVRSHAEVESAAKRATRGPTGVRVDIDVVGTGGSWRVKAKAAKGAHTATSTAGNGTTLKAKAGSTWYASKSVRARHQQILRDAARDLKRSDSTKPTDVEAAYNAKKSLAQQLEARGQAKIDNHIHGIRFDISMEAFSGVKDDHQIKTNLLISPNYEELDINVPAAGDEVELEPIRLKATMAGGQEPIQIRPSAPGADGTAELWIANQKGAKRLADILNGPIKDARNTTGADATEQALVKVNRIVAEVEKVKVQKGKVAKDKLALLRDKGEAARDIVSAYGQKLKTNSLEGADHVRPIVHKQKVLFNKPDPAKWKKEYISKFTAEMVKQLQQQEMGLNKLTLDEWVLNREKFSPTEHLNEMDEIAKQEVLKVLKERCDKGLPRAQARLTKLQAKKQRLEAALATLQATANATPAQITKAMEKAKDAASGHAKTVAEIQGYIDALSQITTGQAGGPMDAAKMQGAGGREDGQAKWADKHRLAKEAILKLVQVNNPLVAEWHEIVAKIGELAVLHDPDQIAGGHGDIPDFPVITEPTDLNDTDGHQAWRDYLTKVKSHLGVLSINSSLGSQWKKRIDKLYTDVIQDPANPQEAYGIRRLNIILKPE